MPRYSQISLQDVTVANNPVPVTKFDRSVNYKDIYKNIPSDLQLNWSNDLIFDHEIMDYRIANHLLAWVQRIYLMLITQKGTNPEAPEFGWDFSYLIDLPDFDVIKLLPQVVRDVKKSIESDPDTLKVDDVVASIVKQDEQTSYIKLEIYMRPKNFSDVVQLSLKIE